ncbi:hypothetical protein LR48_Vigan10g201500 [Vigna angularis]|uniref:Uncharacterized protein n=1 Tax=Phaseolus angularis TaxID=3914 RepID=A0A0L9VMC8_PHAAN|nr:hypothetical protein LR48_Vigan10g201500 [Vigna angularis]
MYVGKGMEEPGSSLVTGLKRVRPSSVDPTVLWCETSSMVDALMDEMTTMVRMRFWVLSASDFCIDLW